VDLYPTLTDLAGVNPPVGLQGVSLRPLLEDANAAWNRAAYTQTVTKGKDKVQGYSVRTERWRFTEWQKGEKGMELYDHDNDPQELKNLANDSAYAAIVAEMKALSQKMHPVIVTPGKVIKKDGEVKKGE
jgi:arylsulfatase A-like enzyme